MLVTRFMSDYHADKLQNWLCGNGRKPAKIWVPKTNAAWYPAVRLEANDLDDFLKTMPYTTNLR